MAADSLPPAGNRSPLWYFSLVFALSVPFWLVGAASSWQLLPGLPLSGLIFICPALAAAWLVYREGGCTATLDLLKRSFDYRRVTGKAWYVPILLLIPGVLALAYAVMRLLEMPLPEPDISVISIPILFLAFFLGALGEELGWSGYVIDPLQERWGALGASLIVGIVWAVWHLVPLLHAGRAFTWIAGWFLMTLALRVLITWLYNNTGKSVFGAALFHASANTGWQAFPNRGSHYDPTVVGPILAVVATLVVLVWGPRTLRRSSST